MSVITMTQMNYVKRIGLDTYRIQNRGGKGIKGMQTREEDVVTKLFLSSNHSYLLYFTDMGRFIEQRHTTYQRQAELLRVLLL